MQGTDLLYLGRSPYNTSDDFAILYSNFIAGIPFATPNNVTTTSATLAANGSYIANNAGLVTLTLPATAAQGTIIQIVGNGAGGWTIAQLASQQIHDGASSTTVGIGGSLSSSQRYNAVTLYCTTANLTWNVIASQGNLTIV